MNIGQVAKETGVSQRMIRHYEKIGLITPPARRDSGYRDYGIRDLHDLRFIARARDLGFSIDDIGRLLALWRDRKRSSAEVKALALARVAELKAKERALKEMRLSLERLAGACRGNERPDCPILSGLAAAG
jgi:Cu(I)-responsive transcriptional regulator